ncbi:MAG TPA: alpha/beta fold hydrolase [Rubrobacter sp.]|nr:alpha/beta fold hydrolase [Rubrobacter sp.]
MMGSSTTMDIGRLPRWLGPANRVIIALQHRGVVLGTMRLLSVPGRKSGKMRTTPVSPLTVEGERYIVGGLESSDWVKNARVAGWGILARGRKEEKVSLVELPVEERASILREFPRRVPHGVQFFHQVYGVSADPEEFAALAPHCPVFRISAAPEGCATGSVVSRDGTTIGYRRIGHGPGVVLLHGAASSGYNHMQLAEALSDAFTVYLPDRRGRGMSGPYSEDHEIQKDIEDLDALLTETGARDVFGVSSGGIICLQAALALPAIRRAAIYEPPLVSPGPASMDLLTRYEKEIGQGKVAASLVSAMKATRMGGPIFNAMPHRLLESFVRMGINREDKRGSGDYVPMKEIAPTLRYDFRIVAETSENVESFEGIRAEVLLLGGSRSPAYMKASLEVLEKILPHATRIELPGLDHAASWNSDRGGRPYRVAQDLRRFFARQ